MEKNVEEKVDLSFSLGGGLVPSDHGYALFGAMCRVLGDLHGASWLAVHPIMGIPRTDGLLALHRQRGQLTVRVVPAEILRVLPLAGKALDIDGHRTLIGVSSVYALRPSASLNARVVVIKGFMEEGPFREAAVRQLDELGVKGDVEVGRRRVVTVNGDKVVGFGMWVRGLSDEDSLKVQYAGVGGRQRFGCGVFVPVAER